MREKRAAALLTDVSEKKWQDLVLAVAKARGWLCYHTHDSRRSEPGFPDLTMVRGNPNGHGTQLVFAELKSMSGQLSQEQQVWLERLSRVPGVRCFVWRPGDLDEVNEALA